MYFNFLKLLKSKVSDVELLEPVASVDKEEFWHWKKV